MDQLILREEPDAAFKILDARWMNAGGYNEAEACRDQPEWCTVSKHGCESLRRQRSVRQFVAEGFDGDDRLVQ